MSQFLFLFLFFDFEVEIVISTLKLLFTKNKKSNFLSVFKRELEMLCLVGSNDDYNERE